MSKMDDKQIPFLYHFSMLCEGLEKWEYGVWPIRPDWVENMIKRLEAILKDLKQKEKSHIEAK